MKKYFIGALAVLAVFTACRRRAAAPRPTIPLVLAVSADTLGVGHIATRAGHIGAAGSVAIIGDPSDAISLAEYLRSSDSRDNIDGRYNRDSLPDFAGEEIAFSDLDDVAGGKGLHYAGPGCHLKQHHEKVSVALFVSACAAAVSIAACPADACGAAACPADAGCGAKACGGKACGAEAACGGKACGSQACGAEALCGSKGCGSQGCGGATGCSAEACALDGCAAYAGCAAKACAVEGCALRLSGARLRATYMKPAPRTRFMSTNMRKNSLRWAKPPWPIRSQSPILISAQATRISTLSSKPSKSIRIWKRWICSERLSGAGISRI